MEAGGKDEEREQEEYEFAHDADAVAAPCQRTTPVSRINHLKAIRKTFSSRQAPLKW
jgi:hypothetical protein